MAYLRFDLRVYGGKADEARVEASRLGRILHGISNDIRDVCRNLSGEDQATSWEEKETSCRIYVMAQPEKGRSLAQPLVTEESEIPWGVVSARAYIEGLSELRSSPPTRSPRLPKGFDKEILRRIEQYHTWLGNDYSGMALDLRENGKVLPGVDFDATLNNQVRLKLAVLEAETLLMHAQPADDKLYGHVLQGVMYELSDPKYEDPEATMNVAVDPHDGTRWICRIPRQLVPKNIGDLFRKRVLVEGTAHLRPRKPEIEVTRFVALPEEADKLAAFDRLMALGEGLLEGEELQTAMDRLRERF